MNLYSSPSLIKYFTHKRGNRNTNLLRHDGTLMKAMTSVYEPNGPLAIYSLSKEQHAKKWRLLLRLWRRGASPVVFTSGNQV
jgi:hypothetical protein